MEVLCKFFFLFAVLRSSLNAYVWCSMNFSKVFQSFEKVFNLQKLFKYIGFFLTYKKSLDLYSSSVEFHNSSKKFIPVFCTSPEFPNLFWRFVISFEVCQISLKFIVLLVDFMDISNIFELLRCFLNFLKTPSTNKELIIHPMISQSFPLLYRIYGQFLELLVSTMKFLKISWSFQENLELSGIAVLTKWKLRELLVIFKNFSQVQNLPKLFASGF